MRNMFSDVPRLALTAAYWLFLVYLVLPLGLMIAMSFKDANLIAFPIDRWTFDWYVKVVQDKQFLDATMYSVFVAAVSTIAGTFAGIWIAVLIASVNLRLQTLLFALACLPAAVPGLISAISLRIFVNQLNIAPGTGAIILGHTIHAVPFVVVMILTRLRSMPVTLIDAARDLGADDLIAFVRVTLPYLAPAILGGVIFCVLLSIDDFVRTFFLGGYRPTLPMLIYAKLRSGMSPEINAMATLVLLVTVAVGLYAEHLTRKPKDL